MNTLPWLSTLLLAVGTGHLLGQDAGVAGASPRVQVVDGRVRAAGPDYAAHFDGEGIEFVPVLGRAAERPYPLRFTLEGVQRGDHVVWSGGAASQPAVAGDSVRYTRGERLTEVYDVRTDGIEQSFVFVERPAGTGDLIVRGRITTDLPLVAASDEGLCYERAGLGGVTFGAVTGVDARGATVRGSIRAVGDGAFVEWILPAAFVDGAVYPMVLDPLIGTSFLIATAGNATSRPAVAYAAGQSRYLAVWRHTVSSTLAEVRAQLLLSNGTPIGGVLTLYSSAELAGPPSVAYVRATNRFLIVWARKPTASPITFATVLMASLSAAGGAPSPTVIVASALLTPLDEVQVAGDSRPAGVANEYACITYRVNGTQIHSRGVHVTAAANPILVGTAQVVASGNVGHLSMAKHAGSAGNWVVAWVHGTDAGGPYQNVSCRVIGAFGVPCSAEKLLALGVASADVRAPACATSDGLEFVVAWEDAQAGLVRVRPCTFTGPCPGNIAAHLLASPVVATGTQRAPSIDFANGKYVLSWLHDAAGTSKVYAKGLDPTTCATCGAEHVLDTGAVQEPDVVAEASGGDAASDEALVVWADGAIRGQRFEAIGSGTVNAMGGACGSTGFDNFNTYDGGSPVLGNADFELSLLSPSTPAFVLLVGLSNVSVPCGPCTLVPALDATVGGSAVVPLPIPCDLSWLGVTFYTQWLMLQPGGCAAFPDYALSNALQFTVGE